MDFSFDQVAVQKPALRTGEDCMEIRIGDENDVKFSYDSNYDLFGSHRLRCVENSRDSRVPDCYRKLVTKSLLLLLTVWIFNRTRFRISNHIICVTWRSLFCVQSIVRDAKENPEKKMAARKNGRANSWGHAVIFSRGYFVLGVFFRVPHDRLSERDTTLSLFIWYWVVTYLNPKIIKVNLTGASLLR